MMSKQKASFIKIYIQSGRFKLNLFPIPFFLSRFTISFLLRIMVKGLKEEQDLTTEQIHDLLSIGKLIFKELKHYPPFVLLELEEPNTKIIIKTK
jgi:hypothetical protein